jgi:hypothetical protein
MYYESYNPKIIYRYVKYLKQFESFQNSKSDYYQEIDYSQYRKDFNYLQEFTQKEISNIQHKCQELTGFITELKFEYVNIHIINRRLPDGSDAFTNQAESIRLIGEIKSYQIFKGEDDWFLVDEFLTSDSAYSNKKCIHYKCDQLIGLIEFIKDISRT